MLIERLIKTNRNVILLIAGISILTFVCHDLSCCNSQKETRDNSQRENSSFEVDNEADIKALVISAPLMIGPININKVIDQPIWLIGVPTEESLKELFAETLGGAKKTSSPELSFYDEVLAPPFDEIHHIVEAQAIKTPLYDLNRMLLGEISRTSKTSIKLFLLELTFLYPKGTLDASAPRFFKTYLWREGPYRGEMIPFRVKRIEQEQTENIRVKLKVIFMVENFSIEDGATLKINTNRYIFIEWDGEYNSPSDNLWTSDKATYEKYHN